ncbi:MAG TPA: hypothetical protein VFJ06_04175, partial [Halococcus sp.]|nr:hypothetical protein [Halococcus sp.]
MSTDRATGNQSTGPTTDELQTQLIQLQRDFEGLQRRFDAFEAEKEHTENKLRSELDDTREQHREDRHALAHENHELRERTRKNERALEHAYDQIDELRNEVAEFQEHAEQAEAERNELREQVENDEKTVVATDGGENPALEPRVSTLEDEQQRAEESRGWIIDDIANAEKRLDELEEQSNRSREDGDLENTLPIQQTTRIWKVGGTIKTNRDEHAAALWSDFFDRCKKGNGIFYLDTSRARSILREHFRDEEGHTGLTEGSSAHVRNIVHRAMDALVDLGGNLVTKRTIKSGRSALVINKEEFDDFCEAIGAVAN